jgi:hypothetical protein
MRPLAMLLGIVMGSTVSLAVGLALTQVVFLLLPEYSERLAPEQGPLARALALFLLLAACSSAAFYGEVRQRSWRRAAQAGTGLLLALTVWTYWPA